MRDQKLRVGICGLGAAARDLHLPACDELSEAVEVVAGCDAEVDARSRFIRAPVFDRLANMVTHCQLDIVIIATPPDCHETDCLTALDAGCHVFCEKPLATSLEAANRMVGAARRSGLHLAVNNQYRWMRIHRAARAMIGAAEFGELQYALVTQRFRPTVDTERGWRGRLRRRTCLEFGIHALDLLRFFYDAEPSSVYAAMPRRRGADPDLLNVIHLDFRQGRSATVVLDRLSRGPEEYLSVRLDGEHADLETRIGGELALEAGVHTRSRRPYLQYRFGLGGSARLLQGETTNRLLAREELNPMRGATKRLFRDFLRSLDSDEYPSSAEDNRRSLRLVMAAYESARIGRQVSISGEDPPAAS